MADFRETLWFKIGFLEAEAETLLPIEDRYLDDGSLTEADVEKFSVSKAAVTPSKPQTKR